MFITLAATGRAQDIGDKIMTVSSLVLMYNVPTNNLFYVMIRRLVNKSRISRPKCCFCVCQGLVCDSGLAYVAGENSLVMASFKLCLEIRRRNSF